MVSISPPDSIQKLSLQNGSPSSISSPFFFVLFDNFCSVFQSVTLHTNLGDIKCEIFCDEVPKTAEVSKLNFVTWGFWFTFCLFPRKILSGLCLIGTTTGKFYYSWTLLLNLLGECLFVHEYCFVINQIFNILCIQNNYVGLPKISFL